MIKGKVIRIKDISPELLDVQEFFIKDIEENYENHFSDYENLPSSWHGRYICSDLFKCTFPLYDRDIDSRKKYATVIHNSAATLAGEYFNIQVQKEEIKKCIFLAGTPGAGKTFFIQSLSLSGELPSDTIVFEGDITSKSIFDKMDKCVDNNVEIYVIVINPSLRLAEENVIKRSNEIGRGASTNLMARIISGIPSALKTIAEKYDIEVGIYNKISNYDIMPKVGIEHISDLEHGTQEEIRKELEKHREEILKENTILENEVEFEYERKL